MTTAADDNHRYAVVVAGGSGTRLWPLSRSSLPKQMHSLVSQKALIVETVDRIKGVLPVDRILVSTTQNFAPRLREMLADIPADNFIVEPVARGTSAAFALIAHTVYERDADAAIFSLASDHVIAEVENFQQGMHTTYEFVSRHPDHVALVGIKPTSVNSELGYIEALPTPLQNDPAVYPVKRFVEKPAQDLAAKFVKSGRFFWNAAYYCFRAETLLRAYDDVEPRLTEAARRFAKTQDPADYMLAPDDVRHEIEVIDSRKFPLAVVPGEFTWSDIGSWSALLEILSQQAGTPMSPTEHPAHVDLNSRNVRVFSLPDPPAAYPVIATAGLEDVIVICTERAVFVLSQRHFGKYPELRQLMETVGMEDATL